jgi:hypothetical protein
MVAIRTERNWVCAYDPRPGDVLIQVDLLGPAGDGIHLRPNTLGIFPIPAYQDWLDWAVAIADQMEHPIHILPLNHDDFFQPERFEPYRKFLANLAEEDREEVRRFSIAGCASAIRDSDDRQVRAQAYDVLVSLLSFYA